MADHYTTWRFPNAMTGWMSRPGYWSVSAGQNHRAVGVEDPDGILWFWIGPHDEYERLIT